MNTVPAPDKPKTIDEYIAGYPKEVQPVLEQVRGAIRSAAPEAEEAISYAIPTFRLNNSYLVYFAGYKNHVGIYPVPAGTVAFRDEVSPYIHGKGTLRFPLDKPLPLDLIRKTVAFRVEENTEKNRRKRKKS
ncbi:MAG TPA: DUF1801 domain-containing protein [Cyclobacteriaceae bacterium]|nr:DUF1801 domain-containing protein [Cyclobacteriaceae bacterium]